MASHLIGQHQVTTFATPINGVRPIDANVVRNNDNTLKTAYDAHDNDTTIHVQDSTLAARPAAGTAGQKWLTTDAGGFALFYDDGASWNEVNYLRAVAGVVTSSSATAFVIGPNGSTNPVFAIDCSTVSAAAGLSLTGAVAAGTVALAVTSSGAAANLSINAKGAGTIGIGTVSTGAISLGRPTSVAGGTVTVSTPVLDISQTWNAGGVAFSGVRITITNTASATSSALFEVLQGATSWLKIAPQTSPGRVEIRRQIFMTDGTDTGYLEVNTATRLQSVTNQTLIFGTNAADRWGIGSSALPAFYPASDVTYDIGHGSSRVRNVYTQGLALIDGVTAPGTITSHAVIYVDTADGDLKVKFSDGTVKTIVVDT